MSESLSTSLWKQTSQESYLDFYTRLIKQQANILLKAGTRVAGSILPEDEVMTKSHQMLICVVWLDKIDNRLPGLVQSKFAREFEAGANIIDLVPLLAESIDDLMSGSELLDSSQVKTLSPLPDHGYHDLDEYDDTAVKHETKPLIKKERSDYYSPLREDGDVEPPSSVLEDIVKLEVPHGEEDQNTIGHNTDAFDDVQQPVNVKSNLDEDFEEREFKRKFKVKKKVKKRKGELLKKKKPAIPLDHDLTCQSCQFTTRLVKEFRVHEKEVHNRSVRYCKRCDIFVELASFKKHLSQAHRSQPSVCPECSKPFRTDQGLLGHRLKVHNIGEGYMCEFCPYKTVKMSHLQNHMKNHSDCPKPYVCNECGARFSRKDSLSNHVKYRHEGVVYYCDQCSFSTPRGIKSFKLHMNKEHLGLIFAKCDKCGQKFKSRYQLRTHMATIHGSGKYFSCPKCDYNATTKQLLQEHDMKVHELIFFRCELCPSKFVRKYALRRHMENVHKLFGVKVE